MSTKTETETEIMAQKKGQTRKMRISAADYQRMGEAGIFADKPRVELIDGEIYTMSPISAEHNSHVAKAAAFFSIKLQGKAIVLPQGSVRIDDYTEPEPDISILRFREDYYNEMLAAPADIHLLIEVAVNTLETDRTVKLRKYAEAGIPEYWIVIPEKNAIEVYREPDEGTYREKATYKKGGNWQFAAFDLPVKGSDLLIG